MFDGHGRVLDWDDLLTMAAWAEVVIIGEEHDDAVGHAFQLAVVTDVFTPQGGRRQALSMEMLERDDQALADDYLDGIIDAATFEKLTHSTDWGDVGMWPEWYQPIVDTAKANGARVVAANAPRRYVRLARTQGFDVLRRLPNDRRAFLSFPRRMRDAAYWRRFVEVMAGDHDDETPPETISKDRMQGLRESFRSQTLWDATMADSIWRAHQAGARKIIHLVGQFHSDFNGGTVQQLRSRWPESRILTISMQRADDLGLREKDRRRADIVVYTGARPAEPETQPESPASQPMDVGSPPLEFEE